MTTKAPWQTTELIRNLKTGKLYFVIQVIRGYATLISPMDEKEQPPTQTLFTRDYDQFRRDCDTTEKDGKWESDTISL